MKKFLNESVISKKEIDDINLIWNKLLCDFALQKNSNIIKCDDTYNVTFYENILTVNTENIGEIEVEYILYIYENKNIETMLKKQYVSPPLNSEANYDERKIIVRGSYYKDNGTINDGDIYISLTHEFHHLYQYQNGFSKTKYQNNLYDNIINSQSSDIKFIRNVGKLLYYTFPHEISASAVELFEYIINNKELYHNNFISIADIKKHSETYSNFQIAIKMFEYYLDNDCDETFETEVKKYFGTTISMIYGRINRAENIYHNYFKKVLALINKRKNFTGSGIGRNIDADFINETFDKKYIYFNLLP